MGMIEKTDVELVEASRRGELEAFGHLVARYQNLVCAVGYSSTGDRVLGEDVAQETFLAAWRQLDRVRDVMRLRPWLCGIARNLGHKARKRTYREQLGELDDHVAATPSAFDELARGDTERMVREALARVPESYREVLILYYREDQSIREVAETLGLNEDAVMQRLSRGRRYLADSVTALVERSLKGARPRRDLVAAVLAAIAAFAIPSHVDASTAKMKGSTMQKLALAASALAAAGTTAYFLLSRHDAPIVATPAGKPLLHYGAGEARPPTLGPTAPRHMTAARKTAASDLNLLPGDSDVVFGIDMSRIQGSALWQQFVAPALANQPALQTALCGSDPLAAMKSVSIGVKGLGANAVAATMVIHGPDKVTTMTCAAKKAAVTNDTANVAIDGDVVLISFPQHADTGVGITFIDDSTELVLVGSAITKADVEQAAAGGSGLASSPAFSELFANINSDDPLWLVVGPSSPLFTELNTSIAPYTAFRVSAVYGSVDVTDSLVIEAGVRLGSPDKVAELVTELQQQLDRQAAAGKLAQYFTQLDVNADGGDVVISVAANTAQLMNIAMSNSLHASATSATPDQPGTFSASATLQTE